MIDECNYGQTTYLFVLLSENYNNEININIEEISNTNIKVLLF